VHSKTTGELVKKSDHASKVEKLPSTPFNATDGVKQGISLSWYLFAVYLDELSAQLEATKAGCCGKYVCVNVCLDPVSVVFNALGNIYCEYAVEHEIVVTRQSVCFSPIKVRTPCSTSCFPEWSEVKFVEVKYVCVLFYYFIPHWRMTMTLRVRDKWNHSRFVQQTPQIGVTSPPLKVFFCQGWFRSRSMQT